MTSSFFSQRLLLTLGISLFSCAMLSNGQDEATPEEATPEIIEGSDPTEVLIEVAEPAVSLDPLAEPLELIEELSNEQIQQTIERIRSEYLRADQMDDQTLEKALLMGLIFKEAPGLSIRDAELSDQDHPFESALLDGHGYISLGSLNPQTAGELAGILTQWRDLDGLILDLRGAQDYGDLQAAADVLDCLLPEKQVLFSTQQTGGQNAESYQSKLPSLYEGSLVVLVDETTHGICEIIAEVLRQQKNALVLGSPTPGRAVLYEEHPLGNNAVLRIATKEVLPPDGVSLFGKGVAPDVVVAVTAEEAEQVAKRRALEGLPSVVFERERPRFNEAALVKGVNPEYAALDEEEAFE
ncbi:MAG: S41 family peptidase, partial [Verrucomicrobiales bacterium]